MAGVKCSDCIHSRVGPDCAMVHSGGLIRDMRLEAYLKCAEEVGCPTYEEKFSLVDWIRNRLGRTG